VALLGAMLVAIVGVLLIGACLAVSILIGVGAIILRHAM
jgi:hypothetical protein